jgi:predicted RNA-binding Zn ribbon-like protein
MADPSQIAPGELELVRAFVNTADIYDEEERIGSPDELTAWLRGNELLKPGDSATAVDVANAIELREALRTMLVAHQGGPPETEAVKTLEAAAAEAGLRLRFRADGGSALEPEVGGVAGALGRLLALVHESMADGSWQKLKVCSADDCWWAFYDHSRNHSRRWCTMSECGNRAKVRSYRRRQAAQQPRIG